VAIIICLATSFILGVIFNIKLNKNKKYLKSLGRYEAVDFSLVYTDGATQIEILKKIFTPVVELEKGLRIIVVFSLIFFMLAFIQLLVLFANH
jgi:hypothetical protein